MSTTEENHNKKARKSVAGDGDNDSLKSETPAPKETKYHRGKWTNEECEYMLGLMEAFKAGHLPLREGTTLRSFLSSMMKCKPKRISKKFEGISYNGRMVYQKSKEAISIQGAMLLRARLSELERRYLAASREQREGHDSIDALLRQESTNEHQEINSHASFLPSQVAVASAFASMPSGDTSLAAARLTESNLGLNLGPKPLLEPKQPSDDMTRLLGSQGLNFNASGTRNIEPSLLNSAATNATSLLSAGMAAGNDAYKLLSQRQCPSAEFPGAPSQSFLSGFHSQLREMEQQQKLAALSSTNAASAIAAMQLRERTLAQLSQATPSSLALGSSLRNEVLPSVGTGISNERGNASDSLGSAQHSLALNRYVLQAPQDDATYFRQRLLPGVNSMQNTSGVNRLNMPSRGSLGPTDLAALLPGQAAGTGDIAAFLTRNIQENEARGLKRPR